MKIAYITSYLGKTFLERYSSGNNFALSGVFKSQGIARALMRAGHEVHVYSPGITSCNTKIAAFSETEEYPEGVLNIHYCDIISKRRRGPINDYKIIELVKRDDAKLHFDIVLYYNINFAAALAVRQFSDRIKILEYEDNLFSSLKEDGAIALRFLKQRLYQYVVSKSDGLLAVCNGIYNTTDIIMKILTPGILNEDAVLEASRDTRRIDPNNRVTIMLIGGVYFAKGPDLLLNALNYISRPCHVIIYSNEKMMEGADQIINRLPSQHKVSIRGFMPHKELMHEINTEADILINTTRNMGVGVNMAGFPFKMMEYASTGRPIVSSVIGKLDEGFNRHITYYEDESPEAVAFAIISVLENYDDKTQLAKQLQEKVLKEYTIEGTAIKLNALINSIRNDESARK